MNGMATTWGVFKAYNYYVGFFFVQYICKWSLLPFATNSLVGNNTLAYSLGVDQLPVAMRGPLGLLCFFGKDYPWGF